MTPYDSFAVVDWSSGNDRGARPKRDAIWIGAVMEGVEQESDYRRNRQVAEARLADLIGDEIRAGRRLLIGFDFPFGYPAGYSRRVTGTYDPLSVWEMYAERLTDTPGRNNRFALAGELNAHFPGIGPFWFNGTGADIPDLPRKGRSRTGHGMREKRRAEALAKGSFSCWQMGGAGAVGGQVMTGMAALARLRRRFRGRIAVWPFEPLDRPVAFVEVWPSLIRDAVRAEGDPIPDRAQVRLLSRALSRLPGGVLEAMLDADEPEEGWILGLGHEDALLEAACQT